MHSVYAHTRAHIEMDRHVSAFQLNIAFFGHF